MRERTAGEPVTKKRPVRSVSAVEAFERPYSVREIAELTGFSIQTVIRIFESERGVLIYEEKRPRKRASYRNIRIPRHVYRRVIAEWTVR